MGMAMTEKQGGSDATKHGLNICPATVHLEWTQMVLLCPMSDAF